jgi:hypothetical protein
MCHFRVLGLVAGNYTQRKSLHGDNKDLMGKGRTGLHGRFSVFTHLKPTSDLAYAFTEVDARLPDQMPVVRRISRILGSGPD